MKIVINRCFGGFSLSPEAVLRCYELGMQGIARPVDEYYPPAKPGDRPSEFARGGKYGYEAQLAAWRAYLQNPEGPHSMMRTIFSPDEKYVLCERPENRADPILARVVEAMGRRANGSCAELKVVEIPDGVEWEIDDYDGMERIAEQHRTWG